MSSEKGLEADPLRREKSAQEMRARELAAARQQLLCADRQNRANETSEQGRERLRAEERKRAAFGTVQLNQPAEERAPCRWLQTESCQTVQRNQWPAGRAPRSWPQAGSFLSVQRKFQGQRRVLKNRARTGSCQTISGNQQRKGAPVESSTRTSSVEVPERKPAGRSGNLTDELNREGLSTPDDEISGRPSLQPGETNILHNRGWADDLENPGLHHEEWAQEEMAAFHRFEENRRHYHCLLRKEAWPQIYLLEVQARQEAVSIIFCQQRHGSW